jgi:uncharacterized protein YjiS (DUF1127 family)
MLPTSTPNRRFAASFRLTGGGSPFPLDASWPIMPIWGSSPNLSRDRASLAIEVRRVFHDLQRDGLVRTFTVWRERIQYRRDLRRLALVVPHMIDDIGLTPDQALTEADRPFWR